MPTIGGLPLQLVVESILSILAMVFLLVAQVALLSGLMLLTIFVTIYLVIAVISSLVGRARGPVATLECVFGILLLLYNIPLLGGSESRYPQEMMSRENDTGLQTAGYVMNIFVGALFMGFYLMENSK